MECKKIRDLLITDYLDGEAAAGLKNEITEHLKSCSECRDFEEEIRMQAVMPFKATARPDVPGSIWLNIEKKIAERQRYRKSLLDLLREKLEVFTLPAPALAFASTAVIILAAFGLIAKQNIDKNQINDYFSQQLSFYGALDSAGASGNNKDSAELGTGVEKYLF